MLKNQSLLLLVDDISGLRALDLLGVEDGASIIVASPNMPELKFHQITPKPSGFFDYPYDIFVS